MEERFQRSNNEWSDRDLCLFINTRTATLLKQIIATTITEECGYCVDIIRERLEDFGENYDNEQKELFAVLEKLTEPITDGDLLSVVDEVVSAAKENLQEIQRLFWMGNPEFANTIENALNLSSNKEEGVRALINGLVHEIISLFGLELKHLISHVQKDYSNVFNAEGTQALEDVLELCNTVASTKTDLEEDERTRIVDYYSKVIVPQVDFQHYFPLQGHKEQEYLEMKVTIKALKDLLHSHDQMIHVYAVKEAQIAEERCKLSREQVDLAQAKVDMDYERAAKSMEIFHIKKEMLKMNENDAQLRSEKAKAIQEMQKKKKELEKDYATLEVKHLNLEAKVKRLVEEKMVADDTIDRLRYQRDYFKMKYEALKLEQVKEDVAELIEKSQTLVLDLERKKTSKETSFDEGYGLLNKYLGEIGKTISDLGAESDVQPLPSQQFQQPCEENYKDI